MTAYSVGSMAVLARRAQMSTSYKPALLKALLRIASGASSTNEIPLLSIGHVFVELYWIQTVVFRLRQAASLMKEPAVVRAVRHAADASRVRDLADLPYAARETLDRRMAHVLKINVLDAFHRSKPAEMPPLFEWRGSKGPESISLTVESRSFLRRERAALESIANLWWARYLEQVNLLAPRVIEKVERNGAERRALGRYLRILRLTDSAECFYCGAAFGETRIVHVDHVIPWSFILSDPLWDLVLSCQQCNLAKSDVLPHRGYLEKLERLYAKRERSNKQMVGISFLTSSELEKFYDAALSVEWPSGWAPRRRH